MISDLCSVRCSPLKLLSQIKSWSYFKNKTQKQCKSNKNNYLLQTQKWTETEKKVERLKKQVEE